MRAELVNQYRQFELQGAPFDKGAVVRQDRYATRLNTPFLRPPPEPNWLLDMPNCAEAPLAAQRQSKAITVPIRIGTMCVIGDLRLCIIPLSTGRAVPRFLEPACLRSISRP